ncbi:MAG: M4 family metallopeptidase, partial [Clostridiales bacterium]|nr:M4 family metallopeptidase [Clostridiales bacterium]
MRKFFGITIALTLVAIMGLCITLTPNVALAKTPETEGIFVTSDPYSALENLDFLSGKDVKEEYRLNRALDVAYGKVYKFIQINNGYDVFGSELVVSVDKDGKVLSVLGEYLPIPSLSENVSEDEAISVVFDLHNGADILSVNKIIYASEHIPELAYDIITDADGGLRYFISAKTGEVLRSFPVNNLQMIVPFENVDALGDTVTINVEYINGKYYLVDLTKNIFVMDAKNSLYPEEDTNYYASSTGVFEPIAVSAYNNIVAAYDFFADEKNVGISIKGINGQNDDISGNYTQREEEIPINVYVHYGSLFENVGGMYSREFNQGLMIIGDGNINGEVYQPARARDVIGHEYQHMLTHYYVSDSYYDGFANVGEPGALGEAFSDIFGALIEGHDMSEDDFWNIGEYAVSPGIDKLRSLKGGTKEQAYTIDEKMVCKLNHDHGAENANCDRNYVHRNSTIISYIQYLLYEQMPDYFTRERTGTLWFTTLCNLTTTATFEDFAFAFLQSASNLGFSREAINTIYTTLKNGELLPSDARKVTFVYDDDTVMTETWVRDGSKVIYPSNPQREATNKYVYEFTGWGSAPETVTSDITIKANFNAVLRSYTVTLISGEKAYSTQSIKYGESMELPK